MRWLAHTDEPRIFKYFKSTYTFKEEDSMALLSAALLNTYELAQMLIDCGANVNIQNNEGTTALHCAVTRYNNCISEINSCGRKITDADEKMIQLLMWNGADMHIKNNAGNSAYKIAWTKTRRVLEYWENYREEMNTANVIQNQ